MSRRIGVGLAIAFTMSGAMFVWPAVSARQQSINAGSTTASSQGQSATQLSDGRWLLLGGETPAGLAAAGALLDPRTGTTTPLTGALSVPRAGHTATVLPDGSVLIIGGHNENGEVPIAELFDPFTQTFIAWPITGSVPRAGHTATLVSDGRVLIVGGSVGPSLAPTEVWDLGSHTAEAVPAIVDRSGHTATLMSDGRVLLAGGRAADGQPLSTSAIVDPATMTAMPSEPQLVVDTMPSVVFSAPASGDTGIPLSARIVVRFSDALRVETISNRTLRLASPHGPLATKVIGAEGGRLVFVWPLEGLTEGTTYTLTVDSVVDPRGLPIAPTTITFTTVESPSAAGRSDEEAWVPSEGAGWRSGRARSPWESLTPLAAQPGVTAVSGRVLRLDGAPLAAVTLAIGAVTAHSDQTGRFLLEIPGVATSEQTLVIDARTANKPGKAYGFYEARIGVRAGMTNVLPFTIWSPLIDTAHQVTIPSPTITDTVVTTPTMPGLELHLPAGTVITDEDGGAVRTVSLTPIPLDRTPFPLPEDATFTMFFTIQPGGAYLATPGPIKGGWLVYPRNGDSPVGKRVRFFNYDPDDRGWFAYGLGTVMPTAVVPDATTRIYGFTGASFNDGNEPSPAGPPQGDRCGNDGDPVNLTTGIFTFDTTDLIVPDVLPLALTRTYNSQDADPMSARPFGIGMTHPYAIFLHMMDVGAFSEADLIQPDGGRIHLVKTAESGANWWQAIFEHTATPTGFYKSRLSFWGGILANGGWQVARQDGTSYIFGHAAPLSAIRDRAGNEIRLTWSTTNTFGSGTGNITRITSPNGRWIAFTYDPSNRITQAQDNIGRTVGYTYDGSGNLATVTDPENHVTSYTWDSSHRMLTVKPPNLQGTPINLVTNEYTTAADAPTPVGWVKKQTHADGGVYQFAYTVSNGKSTQTDVTDPRGHIRRVTFNGDGYCGLDTRAYGETDVQTDSRDRQASGNFVTSSTNPHGDVTTTDYDTLGRVTRVTRLPGTADEAITTYTYDPVWTSEVATITDPLLHTTTFDYDTHGNRTKVTDALSHQTVYTYNPGGQVTSIRDPLQHTTTFEYTGPDLTKTTDPLGRVTLRFFDAAGRLLAQTDPLGQTTRFVYDKVNLTQVTDPLQGLTQYGYDTAGRLVSVTDALNHATTYGYDTLDRLATRTDPLSKVETFLYDVNGNPSQHADRKGQVTMRSYDALNRLQQITYADNSTITYTYDSGNRLTTIVDSVNGTITRTYDNLDRLTSETTPQGSVSYTYDKADRRATMTVGGQPTVTYGYDNANRLTSVTQGTSTVTITYDDASRRSTLTLPNGIVTTYTYDNANQLTGLTYTLGQTTLGTLTYAYDAAGRRAEVGGSWARTGLPYANGSTTYDVANHLMQWAGTDSSYDPNGNLNSDGLTSYIWNARNQLVAVSGGTNGSFTYDGLERRRGKTVSGATTNFLYDVENAVQELTSGGTPSANVLTGLGIDEIFTRSDGSGTNGLQFDALGSSLAITDGSGTPQTHYTFEPFGATTSSGTSSTNASQFTGRESDSANLYYYRARYYAPTMGRFISEDPLDAANGGSLYAYVGNDPISLRDPFGWCAEDPLCHCGCKKCHIESMLVTGYDNGPGSTGKNPGDPAYGITAHGTTAGAGTIAAPRPYRFGQGMYVPGYGCGKVEDRGGKIKGRHIDVWFSSEAAAKEFGARRRVPVEVCDDPIR
jgi:RHS repeat-associated protein